MADQVAEKLKKPQMRRLLHSQIKRNLATALIVTTAAAISFHYTVKVPNKKRYAEFYKHYDIEKEFESMRQKGVFDSCPADN